MNIVEFKKELIVKNSNYANGEFEIISDTYVAYPNKIRIMTIYGPCNMAPESLRRGSNHSVLSAEDKVSYIKQKLKHTNELYRDGNYKILSTNYIRAKSKVYIKSKYGIHKTTWDALWHMKALDISTAVHKTSFLKNELQEKSKYYRKRHYQILGEYTRDSDRILLTDRKGVKYKSTVSNLKRGQFVDQRSAVDVDHYKSVYPKSLEYLRFAKESWLSRCEGKIGMLYLLKCYNESEVFVKVGLTILKLSRRYRGKAAMPYKYEVLATHESYDLNGLWNLEYYLKTKYIKDRYKPIMRFDGSYSECFHIKHSENILNTINKALKALEI